MKDHRNTPPSEIVLDLVLPFSTVMGKLGTAFIHAAEGVLVLTARNHLAEFVMLSTPIHFDGEPSDEAPPRFVLRKLGPTVWKLTPSVLDDRLHAYVTVIDVPDPAPWEEP